MILEAFTFCFLHFLLFYQCLVHTESIWIALPDAERAIRHSAESCSVFGKMQITRLLVFLQTEMA